MPFLPLISALRASCATCDNTLRMYLTTPTGVGRREAKSVEAVGDIAVDTDEAAWSTLSILRVFYFVHVSMVGDADRPARFEDTSTSELVTSVLYLFCTEQPQKPSFAVSSPNRRRSLPYLVHALHLRLRGLVEAHEHFLEWMRARLSASVSEGRASTVDEDDFLTDAAILLRSRLHLHIPQSSECSPPRTARRGSPGRFSYSQLLSTNLYAISTFVEMSAGLCRAALDSPSPMSCREGCYLPQSKRASVLSLLYYLAILTVDVAESSMLCCCRAERCRSVSVDNAQPTSPALLAVECPPASTPVTGCSDPPSPNTVTPSLCLLLNTVLQQEGSQLLERLLRCEQCEGLSQNEMADGDPTHRRLLTRHVLRRLRHLFFRPLLSDGTGVGFSTDMASAVVADRTDAAMVGWMARLLQLIAPVGFPTVGRNESGVIDAVFSVPAIDKQRRPNQLEAECLAELLRVFIYQLNLDAALNSSGASPHPGGLHRASSHTCSSTAPQGIALVEDVTVLSSLPESVELFLSAIGAAPGQGNGAPTSSLVREVLLDALENVVSYVLRCTP